MSSSYVLAGEHPHKKPSIFELIERGGYLVILAGGGLALRYGCSEGGCGELIEDRISGTNFGSIVAIFHTRGVPIQNEHNPLTIHEALGLPTVE